MPYIASVFMAKLLVLTSISSESFAFMSIFFSIFFKIVFSILEELCFLFKFLLSQISTLSSEKSIVEKINDTKKKNEFFI